ncbi:hypothetical protein [Stutzerimonas stutzeri]|uniref:hypothetical protein n=1 Tax=Stutzerimonas stutzeri TaxID=316 RepID=UPI0031452C56
MIIGNDYFVSSHWQTCNFYWRFSSACAADADKMTAETPTKRFGDGPMWNFRPAGPNIGRPPQQIKRRKHAHP